jgi:hypothetical protein
MLAAFRTALVLALLTARAPAQQVLAQLELAAPGQPDFILRGTLPVPPGTYPRPDGLVPFRLRDADGSLVATQVEPVAWYPDLSKGCDVVEVLAHVHLPLGVNAGDFVRYDVVDAPDASVPIALDDDVRALLTTPGAVKLRARDVFGHLYELDVLHGQGGSRNLRRGSLVVENRHSGVMTPVNPVNGTTGTLPHLMAVQAYARAWRGEQTLSLDLRVHNGVVDLDPSTALDDPMASLYFDRLELVVPEGWMVMCDLTDPFLGPNDYQSGQTVRTLVRPNAGGEPHVMEQKAQLHRRVVLTKIGNVTRARTILKDYGLAFPVRGLNAQGERYHSWWNPDTARYFPQRQRMPDLDHLGKPAVRANLASSFYEFEFYLANGTSLNNYPLEFPALGWAHPWGVQYGGMTSGTEISLYDGVDVAYGASNEGYRFHQLKHRMYTERMPDVMFNLDGEPTRLAQWVVQGPNFPYVHMLFYQGILFGNDPFGFADAPTFQVDFVQQNGAQPPYEGDLLAFEPIDLQHLVRYLNSAKVLAWLGNDSLAKDDLRMQAEISRLSYHMYPTEPSGNAIVSGMLTARWFVDAHPGVGFSFGRGHGWMVDAMSCAYAFGSPAWRAEARPWFDDVVDLVGDAQILCSGFIQAEENDKWLSGAHRARQSIEQAIVEHALWGVLETVHMGVDPARELELSLIISRSAYGMISYPAWDPSGKAPWSILAVGPLDVNQPAYCGYLPGHGSDWGLDKYQIWNSFAYGYKITADPLFLQRALECSGGSDLNGMMEAWGLSNLENRAALLALSQEQNYP